LLCHKWRANRPSLVLCQNDSRGHSLTLWRAVVAFRCNMRHGSVGPATYEGKTDAADTTNLLARRRVYLLTPTTTTIPYRQDDLSTVLNVAEIFA